MSDPNKQSGFTLIEILIVVFIMAIVVGMVSLNFNRNLDSVAHNEAKRFARVLSYTKEYSAYTGRILSLRLDQKRNTYFFLYVDPVNRSWNRLDENSGSKLLSPHTINRSVEVEAEKRKAETAQTQLDTADNGDKNTRQSQVSEIALITPFSDFEPADLIISGDTKDYIVTTDEFDDVKIQIR